MKQLSLVFSLFIAVTLNAQQKLNHYNVRTKMLEGLINKEAFLHPKLKEGFNANYKWYKPNPKFVAKIEKRLKGITIIGFLGSWCADSEMMIPELYKLLEQTSFNFNKNLTLIAINRSKTIPKGLLDKDFEIKAVPTIFFYKNGKEIGKLVEYPEKSLEEDIYKILK